jgi:NAD dependent epimerase/dehydratase family enzyme
MSWVGLEDVIGALNHCLFTDSVRGPVNLVAPNPVTSRDFAKTLGRVLSRPAIAPLPRFALKALFGEMAEATILAGQRVEPAALHSSGFSFMQQTLEPALRFALGRW